MIKDDQLKVILTKNDLFKNCSEETLDAIVKMGVELNLEKGQIIYRPGDTSDNVYILAEGIVTFLNKAGLEFLNVQRVMDRSMVFGWIALVPEHTKRIGTAQCLEDSKIIALNGQQLIQILDRDVHSGYEVMKSLCTMISSTME